MLRTKNLLIFVIPAPPHMIFIGCLCSTMAVLGNTYIGCHIRILDDVYMNDKVEKWAKQIKWKDLILFRRRRSYLKNVNKESWFQIYWTIIVEREKKSSVELLLNQTEQDRAGLEFWFRPSRISLHKLCWSLDSSSVNCYNCYFIGFGLY